MKITYKLENRVSKSGIKYWTIVIYLNDKEVEMLMVSRPTQALLELANVETK